MSLPSHLGVIITSSSGDTKACELRPRKRLGVVVYMGSAVMTKKMTTTKKSSLEWPQENNWLKSKGRNKWKRLETAGKSDFYCHMAKKDNEKPAGG